MVLVYSLLSLTGRDKRQIKVMTRSNEQFTAAFFGKILIKIDNIHFWWTIAHFAPKGSETDDLNAPSRS
ncbi:MAG: hypothetical protein CBC46_11505 [Verrucomicrobiaceae bacterium TMED86]|nr:MAG: hypothetical protein CBC46_11505 [Verrucomicrobiaceae bacterium TMED86]